jgi:hypothetical protein
MVPESHNALVGRSGCLLGGTAELHYVRWGISEIHTELDAENGTGSIKADDNVISGKS